MGSQRLPQQQWQGINLNTLVTQARGACGGCAELGLLGPRLHCSQALIVCLLTLPCPVLFLRGGHAAYREPYLFVTHFNSLEVIEIQARSSLG